MKKEVGNKKFKKWGLLGKGVRVLKTGRAVTPFQTMVNRHTCIEGTVRRTNNSFQCKLD